MKTNFTIYATILMSDIAKIDFTQIGQTSERTVRASLDSKEFVIKYNTIPSFIQDGSVVPVNLYTYKEILVLMQSPEWSEPIETK